MNPKGGSRKRTKRTYSYKKNHVETWNIHYSTFSRALNTFCYHDMKFLPVALLCLTVVRGTPLKVASSHLIRAPSHDSAVIKSDRHGGNFAYSTAEAHAYAAVTPIIHKVVTPVAVSYAVPAPMIPYTPTSAYALESATLPKEHRGLTESATPLSTHRRTIKS